jgi:predicted metal-binding membrane protein
MVSELTTPGNTITREVRRVDGVAPPPRASREPVVYLIATLVFLVSAGLTVWFCWSMAGGMDMPGGWTMSMMWMPMPGQTWLAVAGMFLLMWVAMMVAMMLPSALPALVIYRRALHFRQDPHASLSTFLMACGYFFVWAGVGVLAFAVGVAVAWATMRWSGASRSVPVLSGIALIVCGLFQFTPWKMSCLKHCRDPLCFVASHLHGGPRGGWILGLHHGLFCAACCWGLMLIQLVLGVMNIGVMALVAGVIALEKLVPRAEWIVWLTGTASIAAGLVFIGKSVLFR